MSNWVIGNWVTGIISDAAAVSLPRSRLRGKDTAATELRAESYFRQRMNRANREEFLAILEKAGTAVALEGDELPPEFPPRNKSQ